MDVSPELLAFALEKSPLGVVVFDAGGAIVYRNAGAERFLERHALPPEVPAIVARVFDAVADGTAREQFSGQIFFSRVLGKPARRWTFRVDHRERPTPLVCVHIAEVTASSQVDLNAVRREFGLTRRETDLVRFVLDGRTNQEISRECGIIEQTVKDHLSNVYRKMDVKNRVALLRLLLGAAAG